MHLPSQYNSPQIRATEEKRQGKMENKEVQLPFVQIFELLQQAKVPENMRPEQATQTTDIKADLWKVARRKASIEVFLHSSMYGVTDLCPCLMRATFLAYNVEHQVIDLFSKVSGVLNVPAQTTRSIRCASYLVEIMQ